MTDPTRTDDAVVLERTFDAPPEVVWRMWTEGDEFAAWYGPAGATIPVADIDATVGGARRVCMEVPGPNGPFRMWFAGEHLVVEPPSVLVYSEQITDESGTPTEQSHLTEVRIELSAAPGGGTRVVLTHRGIPSESPGATGWAMALDALAAHLGS